ncbi:MAG: zinc ribbon domain-containing protein [Armatimonadota bacterium]
MKCQNCFQETIENARFCPHCGKPIKKQDENKSQQTNSQPEQKLQDSEPTSLAEQLMEMWRLYESLDFDGALDKGHMITSRFPDSASAHSMVALVYERKADKEMEAGNIDFAKNLLKAAIAQYDIILKLNPDSAADKEKLDILKKKMSGELPMTPAVVEDKPKKSFKLPIPLPVIISAVIFVILVAVALLLIPPSGTNKPGINSNMSPINEKNNIRPPSGPEESTTEQTPAPSVYVFPEQTGKAEESTPPPPPPQRETGRTAPNRPVPAAVPDMQVVPRDRENRENNIQSPSSNNNQRSSQDTDRRSDVTQPNPNTLLNRAFTLESEGRNVEAVAAAERAKQLFQQDIDKGRNVDAAKNGIRNAEDLIERLK